MNAPEPALPKSPRQRRKGRDAEATRDEVLVAAMEEFAEKGLHGARIEEIAARMAVSKHMIYYYFGSKDGLYGAALARAYEDFRHAERDVDYRALDPVTALKELAGNTFDSHVANPHVIRILMSENLDHGRHAKDLDHGDQRRLVIETTRDIIERGRAAGLFRDDIDPVQFHLNVSALSFFSIANRYTFGRVFDFDMADPAVLAVRRAEVIEVMLSRCLRRDG
ncbi:TetR/AcrR family transcriptional regulator [Novosphingobium sp.]|uniref:TetR/AcrR family transcriptional regulator n=1 Tax=Novosphingobium sp. TaxID=1874826 RepID=UPI002616CE22|nr:TetR/AcrR family transcriptional regulator [Novosphingobium sp.]